MFVREGRRLLSYLNKKGKIAGAEVSLEGKGWAKKRGKKRESQACGGLTVGGRRVAIFAARYQVPTKLGGGGKKKPKFGKGRRRGGRR